MYTPLYIDGKCLSHSLVFLVLWGLNRVSYSNLRILPVKYVYSSHEFWPWGNCHRMVPGPTGPLDGHERKLCSSCDLHKSPLRHMDHSDIWDLLELVSVQRQCPVTNTLQHFNLPKPLNLFLYRTSGRSCILNSFTVGQLLVHVSDNQPIKLLGSFLIFWAVPLSLESLSGGPLWILKALYYQSGCAPLANLPIDPKNCIEEPRYATLCPATW